MISTVNLDCGELGIHDAEIEWELQKSGAKIHGVLLFGLDVTFLVDPRTLSKITEHLIEAHEESKCDLYFEIAGDR